jgi:DNA (cytosine-5)-methyltransferase 1
MAQIDYPAHLETMWQKATAPRESNAPTVVSTFAGGGGSLTGYMMAGFRDLLAVEWDDNAVETLRLNWPELDIYHGDIAELSVEEVLTRTGLEVGQLDILDGSPPCQGFSTAGKRQFDDDRNQLFHEFARLLRGLMPKAFIMENVSGMVKGKMKLIFAEILQELKASGYRVKAAKLNAQYFHVPQSRERLIFVGVRDDLGIEPGFPVAQGFGISIRKAVEGVKPSNTPEFNDSYARLWHKIPIPTGRRSKMTAAFLVGKGFTSCVKPNPQMPAPTLPKMQTGRGYATITHWNEPRALAINEAKRIHSYPSNYQFKGDYSTKWERIGNSVPPLFMEAIARHVRAEILERTDATGREPELVT